MTKSVVRIFLTSALTATIVACGGGGGGSIGDTSSTTGGTTGGSTTVNNVQSLIIDGGPLDNYANGVFTSVTICVPSTSTCQTIDHVLVDTGSYGLRLLGSAVTLAVPVQTNNSGSKIGECTTFADGYTWGPVAAADVYLGNQIASSVPINLIGSTSAASSFPNPPVACSSGAGTEEDTLSDLASNGILGVGVFAQDCGNECATDSTKDIYFACSSLGVCTSTLESLANQVTNPVALLSSNKNGVVIELPSISASGAQTTTGSMIMGIGTQSNNSIGSAKVLTTDGFGQITATYNGTSYPKSFIDSGSNGLFFSSTIADCTGGNSDFYCPTSTLSLSAQMTGSGSNIATTTAAFSVANANTLFNSGNFAFNDLAGSTGTTLGGSFDFGLPFFFGRNIFFGLYNEASPGTAVPYFAY